LLALSVFGMMRVALCMAHAPSPASA
jgi:hypothetical protein